MLGSDLEHWRQAINEKLEPIEDSPAWTRAVLSTGKAAIPCKMAFKQKHDKRRRVPYYRARLVAKRLLEKLGIDYYETVGTFVAFEVLLLLVWKCISDVWHVHHASTSAALLKGNIDYELFAGWNDLFYMSRILLHGLKKSSRLWYEKFKKLLKIVNSGHLRRLNVFKAENWDIQRNNLCLCR